MLATGRALTLSVREFELLVAMAKRLGAIITREELYRTVWGGELRRGDRSVDVYVSKLRSKLETALPDRRFIHTHPGFGYRFQPAAFTKCSHRDAPAGLERDCVTGTPGAGCAGRRVLHGASRVQIDKPARGDAVIKNKMARSQVAPCSRSASPHAGAPAPQQHTSSTLAARRAAKRQLEDRHHAPHRSRNDLRRRLDVRGARLRTVGAPSHRLA